MPMPIRFDIVNIGTLSMNKFWGETERRRSGTATCTLLARATGAAGRPVALSRSARTAALRHTGLRPADIDHGLLTHFHGDHRFGLAALPAQADG